MNKVRLFIDGTFLKDVSKGRSIRNEICNLLREECGEFTDVDLDKNLYGKLKLKPEGVISEKVVQFL